MKSQGNTSTPFRGSGADLVDFGPNTTSIRGNYLAPSIIVCRSEEPPTLIIAPTVSLYIFVPSNSVTIYKEASVWSDLGTKIKAIGGEEWVTVFGSSDEYADYDLYGVPHS